VTNALLQAIAADPGPNDAQSRLLRAYDRSVLACNSGDFVRAHRAIGTLRAVLELDTDASRAFDAIFQWCEGAIDRADYAGASRCLAALREKWATVAVVRPTPRSSRTARDTSNVSGTYIA
jgi:hypothetical protein